MGEETKNMTINLSLTTDELCSLIEALYDSMMDRIGWTVGRSDAPTTQGWDSLEWEIAQTCIDQLASAYAKSMMLLKSMTDEVVEGFEQEFTPLPAVWDLLNEISLADGWESAPRHEPHLAECEVCDQLALA